MVPQTIAIDAALKRCLTSPYLREDPSKLTQARNELDVARTLYAQAEQSFRAADEATGLKQAWGAAFRAARGLVYAAGYDVDGLRCMEVLLEARYLSQGLTMDDITALRKAQELVGPPDAALARARAWMELSERLLTQGRG